MGVKAMNEKKPPGQMLLAITGVELVIEEPSAIHALMLTVSKVGRKASAILTANAMNSKISVRVLIRVYPLLGYSTSF
jgi:hypothetical protein